MTLLTEHWNASPLLHVQRERQLGPTVVRMKQRHLLSWLLLGYWLSAGSVSAAVVWFEIVYWPFSTLTLQGASADVFEPNPHKKANKLSAMESRTPHLGFHNSSGVINEPLPLGITL